ncbi:uncharacterized protein LOC111639970 [Centruroides sculpturatus]|uniref:uncharacterized protein LOC111639970 n=1 Tax=Centruroides sculpturatus TaxID=218467 RepID=UPI000C6CBC7B|nr:uncharacterized protein LOC111639970 [Centruroides sculpturatus]XP_023241726.1 uncharacterized protein LOC111639970 [Centruroides sculpturatus]XP_023241727.1 uncharacterized protein LOC111639970 [Centruroides sculpturatus]XP_023241728.1 uncharacterized protein LOC111639970 [Centruroides sculpturatus]XP_023241729.1 uncharacterized protein LOC111639970 [Centruroides sculpturatus]
MLLNKILRRYVRSSVSRSFLKLAVLIICVIFLWNVYIYFIEWSFFYTHFMSMEDQLSTSSSCDIPVPDPFDESIMKYVVVKEPLKCKFIQPDLTYLDYDGVLHLNQSSVAGHHLEDDLSCRYSTFARSSIDDDNLVYDPEKVLYGEEKILEGREFVAVNCSYKGKLIYRNYHAYVPKKKTGIKINNNMNAFKPQVFILVIESMSRLNMIRNMPKTYSYLTDNMKAEILKGMTKVGDNSFPNMVPFLTGRKVGMSQQEFPGKDCSGPFDDWPFIWKNYSKAGYVTALTEDNPEFTLFNYISKGFLKQPTDFYPRPLWLGLFQSPLLKMSSDFCLGSVTSYQILFNWIKEFVIKHREELYFLFSFYIAIAHNDFNEAQLLDNDAYNLLKDLNEKGYFKNAIVVVMGDHGSRFGKAAITSIGRVEERMPLFSITLPSTLEDQHPHLRTYLKRNSDRLTTWFDVHSMLMDIMTSTYKPISPTHIWNSRGYSPWRMMIPTKRTCEKAGIPENYCVCEKEIKIPPTDQRCLEAANKLVQHLNQILEPVKLLCAQLSLRNISKGKVLMPSKSTAYRRGYAFNIRVLISVKPSEAILEALLQKTAWSTEFKVIGDVSRLNKYGNQSSCIQHRELRKFCYCNNQFTHKK